MNDRVTGVLMCPPDCYTVRDVKNPFMNPDAAIDPAAAARQWTALCDTFARLGVTPEFVEPADDCEDMVFTANQVFVGSGAQHVRFVVPSRMRYASRQREVSHVVTWFERRGYAVLDLGLRGDAFLEGHGDLLQQPGRRLVWAGYGFRSSAEGVQRFADAMHAEEIRVAPLRLIDPTFYHLDTCFMPLNEEASLIYPGAFDAQSLDLLRRTVPRLHEVTRDEAMRFVCNGARANEHFVVAHDSPALAGVLTAEGLTPVRVDVSEFEKGGGSVFCLKCFF